MRAQQQHSARHDFMLERQGESGELIHSETAIAHSTKAFREWKQTGAWERKALLVNLLKVLQDRFDNFKEALLADVSMSDILIGADRKSSINLVDGAATTAISLSGSIPSTLDGHLAMSTRQPFGPVLSIPAFNFPMTLALRSIVDPLACGNTVIMKASTYIPQLHALLGPLFKDAGFPDAVLQILHLSEDSVARDVEALIGHRDVRMLNFTGSTDLGRTLAATCGKNLKPSVMELGGKSAAVVLPCADLKLAANNIVFGAMLNSGQICMSTERILAHRDIIDNLQNEIQTCMEQIGNRAFEVIRPGSVKAVQDIVAEAQKEGARHFSPSTSKTETTLPAQIIYDPSATSRIWSEETFSPTVTLSSFASTDLILEALHSVATGLSTSIFGSLAAALELSQQVQSGMVHINSMTVHDEYGLPFGGVRDSGWGRFNGQGAIESFTWIKNVSIGKRSMLPLQAL